MIARPTLLLALLFATVPPVACQVTDSAPPEGAESKASERVAEGETEGAYRPGDAVEIQWHGGWYRGHVLEAEDGQFKVHYDGYGDSWDEWVGVERLRRIEVVEGAPGPEVGTEEAGAVEAEPPAGEGAVTTGVPASSREASPSPPLGKYVCRQYTTTMGYLTLRSGGVYEVSGVTGRYRYDSGTGEVAWQGGSYADWGWAGRYEHVSRSADDGRPDEDIIRLTSEADGLRIACYKMAGD